MEAKELRIGNLVYFNGKNKEIGVISEIKTSIAPCLEYVGLNKRSNIYYQTKHLQPIPLTEEILLKCGFDFGIKLQDFVKGKYQFVEITNTIDGYFSEEGIIYYGLITKIKHLHQLQNLYFALTGEELEINL